MKVTSKIVDEKGKERLQAFEGIVIARKHGTEPGATFTVRKVASGVGVERIFPLFSPVIEKIEVTKKSRSRRSKLYYIRDKALRRIRKKLRLVTGQTEKNEYVESDQELEIPEEEMMEESADVESSGGTNEDAGAETETETENK